MSTVLNDIAPDVLNTLTTDQAWHYRIIPKSVNTSELEFWIDSESNIDSSSIELEMIFGKAVELRPLESKEIQRALSKHYRKTNLSAATAALDFRSNEKDFARDLINEAKSLGSSDIHIETYDESARIRIRIDGKLIERYHLSKSEYPSLINKLKIMSNLDIAEKRLPQDGRIQFETPTDKFDIRISILPTLYGEKIVMRILSNDATDIDIQKLGFNENDIENYLEGIKRPNGMVLISGPTGSGKTTTLYASLKILNNKDSNILTIEDPIEYTLEGINQVQLKESIGLTFGKALRTFLRQDPDIIMVGEIRDEDTANMAIRAALTGHLVLSTIHTNSAWGTVARLIDMGVPPFLLANTLNTTVAQRLVRKLCEQCKSASEFDTSLLPKNYKPSRKLTEHYVACGCDECHQTGYSGRTAIYEVITVDDVMSDNIKNSIFDVSKELKERKVKSLSESAFKLLEEGITTIEEVYPLLVNY